MRRFRRVAVVVGRTSLIVRRRAPGLKLQTTVQRLLVRVLLPWLLFGCGSAKDPGGGGASGGDGGGGASGGSSGTSGTSATGGAAGEGGAAGCPDGEELFRGKCVAPERRYEPDEPIDLDNIVSYGETPQELQLPPAPRSGFRLIVSPRTLAPGEEYSDCIAWAYPQIQNHLVYGARLYTNGALHHSNLMGVPLQKGKPSPYPACSPGQADISGITDNILAGEVPEVLFANSTQVLGEAIVFEPGMAYRIAPAGREMATNIHYLNTAAQEKLAEVVYDFFTMPDSELQTELYPYYFDNYTFIVPPHTTEDVATTCQIFGGNIVSLMPHTHSRTSAFTVDLVRSDETTKRIYEDGAFDTDSDIAVFADPISMEGFASLRHACTIENDLDVPIDYGIGNNEMCTLFGFMYPKPAQTIGVVQSGDTCLPVNVGKL